MEVAANGIAVDGAFGAIAPVVAAADTDAAHGSGAGAEGGETAMVLEAD